MQKDLIQIWVITITQTILLNPGWTIYQFTQHLEGGSIVLPSMHHPKLDTFAAIQKPYLDAAPHP